MASVRLFILAITLLLFAVVDAQKEKQHKGYHFGPHTTHNPHTLSKSEFRRMALEDLDQLQADIESSLHHQPQPHHHQPHEADHKLESWSGVAIPGLMSLGLALRAAKATGEAIELGVENAFPEPPTPPRMVPVPPAVKQRWEQMRRSLTAYYFAVHEDVKLDSKFTMFSTASTFKTLAMLQYVLALDAASLLQEDLVDVAADLRHGNLDTAQAAMDACLEASKRYHSLYLASGVVKGIINAITLGLSDGIEDIASALSQVADQVITLASFETIEAGLSVIDTLTHPTDNLHTLSARQLLGSKAVDVVNSTASIAADLAYSVVTLGIGPLVGITTGKVVESVELKWLHERNTAACMLGAFGAMAESLGLPSSVAAQGVQYRVTSRLNLIEGSGKFSDLVQRAYEEYRDDPDAVASGVISSQDIYNVLRDNFRVLSKFKSVTAILTAPGSGVSEKIRETLGNEYEKASKYAGVNLVAFLKNCFWREFFLAVTTGAVPISEAGFFNSLVVSGDLGYVPLYRRFGRANDYAEGAPYADSYGCSKDKKCWVYCGRDKTRGNWCYAQNPYNLKNTNLKCESKDDCFDALSPIWSSLNEIPCGGRCNPL